MQKQAAAITTNAIKPKIHNKTNIFGQKPTNQKKQQPPHNNAKLYIIYIMRHPAIFIKPVGTGHFLVE